MRMHSPITATASPTLHVIHVGLASTSVKSAVRKPRGTRLRASVREKVFVASAMRSEKPTDAVAHFVDADAVDARRGLATPPFVEARALRNARNDNVAWRPWAVAFRKRRSEQRDDGRPDGAGNVERSGVARDHEAGRPRNADKIRNGRLRCGFGAPQRGRSHRIR